MLKNTGLVKHQGHGRLLLSGQMVAPCFDPEQLIELGIAHRQQWYLAPRSSVLPTCSAVEAKTIYHINNG